MLVNRAYPYGMMATRFTVHYFTRENGLACDREAFKFHLNTVRSMYTWVESKHNLFYCVDISKLLRYSNVCLFGIDGSSRFDSEGFNGKLLDFVMDNITKSLANNNIEDINRMLHFYGITDADYESMQSFFNDIHVYKSFLSKLRDEVILRSEQVVQDFFDDVKLYDIVKAKLINGTMLPLVRYDTKNGKVYVPNVTNISYVDLMSRSGSGKDGRKIFDIDDFLSGSVNLSDNNVLYILTRNDYDIPLGGAFSV